MKFILVACLLGATLAYPDRQRHQSDYYGNYDNSYGQGGEGDSYGQGDYGGSSMVMSGLSKCLGDGDNQGSGPVKRQAPEFSDDFKMGAYATVQSLSKLHDICFQGMDAPGDIMALVHRVKRQANNDYGGDYGYEYGSDEDYYGSSSSSSGSNSGEDYYGGSDYGGEARDPMAMAGPAFCIAAQASANPEQTMDIITFVHQHEEEVKGLAMCMYQLSEEMQNGGGSNYAYAA